MATKFLEPGTSATQDLTFFSSNSGSVSSSSAVLDIGPRSLLLGSGSGEVTKNSVCQDSGTRISTTVYFTAFSTNTGEVILALSSIASKRIRVIVKSTGQLAIQDSSSNELATGSTLSTATWYRLCLAYTITDASTNEIRLFLNGTLDISISNGTGISTGTAGFRLYNDSLAASNYHHSIYVDDSSSLTDPGSVGVTAKRPNANGTTNDFSTQIGAGGSGYGTGHSPQVNERPLSTTNGWSMVGAGSAVTEEYTVEDATTGDIDISGVTLIDYIGWIYASSLVSETGKIIVAGVNTNKSLTSTNTFFQAVAGSTTYPTGGTDIGLITSTTLTTVSLYECGLVFAYIRPAPVNTGRWLLVRWLS